MRGRYKLAFLVAAAIITYSALAATIPAAPQGPVLIVDLPERVCVGVGCLYPQAYAVIVYAPAPPGGEPFIDVEYVSSGSKVLFSLPSALYDPWSRYLVRGGGPAIPSVGVVALAYTSREIAYSIKVVADASSPLAPISSGVREVAIEEDSFHLAHAPTPRIPGYGSPENVPEGARWGDVAPVGIEAIDRSPVLIRSSVGSAARSPYVKDTVRLSESEARVTVSGTPAVVSSVKGIASTSVYLEEGLYAVIFTYEGIPVYVAGVVRASYTGLLAEFNATVALNASITAWVNGVEMIPLLYPLSINLTLLYWVSAPLAFMDGINFSLTDEGACVEAPMRVGRGDAIIKVGQDIEGLYIGDLAVTGIPYGAVLKASLYPLEAEAVVMAYSSSPVVEIGLNNDLLGGICVVGHRESGWGGGCVDGYCPG